MQVHMLRETFGFEHNLWGDAAAVRSLSKNGLTVKNYNVPFVAGDDVNFLTVSGAMDAIQVFSADGAIRTLSPGSPGLGKTSLDVFIQLMNGRG
jgi:hypothetical protein